MSNTSIATNSTSNNTSNSNTIHLNISDINPIKRSQILYFTLKLDRLKSQKELQLRLVKDSLYSFKTNTDLIDKEISATNKALDNIIGNALDFS